MKRWAGIAALLALLGTYAACRYKGEVDAAAKISITLVPPSPVTDKVALDVRAGIRNNDSLPGVMEVSFYLDKENAPDILFRRKIRVAAHASESVQFRWPTKGQAGHHKIILVVRSGQKHIKTERPVRVIASDVRSTKKIGGAWIGFYHWSETEGRLWNKDIQKMTGDQWRELVDAMHQLKMNVIVIQEVFRNQLYYGKHNIEKEGYKGRAFYPSTLYPGRMPIAAKDPVEAVLSEADKNGMHVFIGVGLYAWFDFSKGSCDWHKKVAGELWKRYGHHPSFYGWYISEEIEGGLGDEQQQKDIVNFFRDFKSYVNQLAPGKPVMLATNCHNTRGAEKVYRQLLPYLDILCPFGFARMPEGDITGSEAAVKLQKLCDEAGVHLWMDMEAFLQDTTNALYPRPMKEIAGGLAHFTNFEKILCYQFSGIFNSPAMSVKPGGKPTVRLFREYKQYLETGEGKTDHNE